MKKAIKWMVMILANLFVALMGLGAEGGESPAKTISWKRSLSQSSDFYGGREGIRIADNVLLYQRLNGGWLK